jgi:hypothetical protein
VSTNKSRKIFLGEKILTNLFILILMPVKTGRHFQTILLKIMTITIGQVKVKD